jgi:hypothetical protein
MRGRNGGGNNNSNNNNNRRGTNQLNRNYESNGPDVKIRGSAQQIAEKYATLARDAQSSGDRVMAENYLQHAEHYNRIIAAAQAQMPIQNSQANRDDLDDDEGREDFENGAAFGEAQVPATNHGAGPQPEIDGAPAEVALNGGREGRDGNSGNRNNRDRRNGGGYGQRGEQTAAQGDRNASRENAQVEGQVEAAPAASSDLGPAGLAAQVEQAESAGDKAPPPRRARKPRQAKINSDAGEGNAEAPVAAEASDTPAPADS